MAKLAHEKLLIAEIFLIGKQISCSGLLFLISFLLQVQKHVLICQLYLLHTQEHLLISQL